MPPESLEAAIDQAFSQGANQQGLELLRQLNSSKNKSPSSLNRQAVIEEQIGDWARAGQAHLDCIELVPHFASAYLYAGYWLQQSNRLDAAAAVYSLAAEADPNLFHGISQLGTAPTSPSEKERQKRLIAGNALLRQELSEQHRKAMLGSQASQRMCESSWQLTHDKPIQTSAPNYQPQLFLIPDLPTQAYYANETLPWVAQFESHYKAIKHEYHQAMSRKSTLRPYLGVGDSVPNNLSALTGSLDWSALDIYRDGVLNEEHAAHFPATLEALSKVPTYQLSDQPYEVFFSILKPNQSIAPHFGQSNHSLTVHLPIEVPNYCFLEVDQNQRPWQEGKILAFDDNYLHAAFNNSESIRVVLIFSIWHPELSSSERESVRTAFRTRQQWMLTRREKLQELISS